jgi:hypothetical protein
MCEACKATGLYRPCDMCSGYDWVEDIYEWADDARTFRARLCGECFDAWCELMKGSPSKRTRAIAADGARARQHARPAAAPRAAPRGRPGG